jgi:hypothetical protein
MVFCQEFYRGHAEDNGEVLSVREQEADAKRRLLLRLLRAAHHW